VTVSPAQLLLAVLAAKLTPNQVDAFIDHAVMGRGMQEVADEYGCSYGNVRQAVGRARAKLQRLVRMEMAA
jgi:DNA-directed RNA polymerase specialized sigma24 family protein